MRYVIALDAALRLFRERARPAEGTKLVAPTLLRSQAVAQLYATARRGEIDRTEAKAQLDHMRALNIRLLGDRVLQNLAWTFAERLGWEDTFTAEYVALTKVLASEMEFLLKSGDEVDVCITSAEEIRLVEVKSRRSNMVDFERGIYQCVKYRAVYEAMSLAVGVETTVVAVLATETSLPARLKELAKKLDIITKVVEP